MRSWLADGCMCGHRKITCDLHEAGEGAPSGAPADEARRSAGPDRLRQQAAPPGRSGWPSGHRVGLGVRARIPNMVWIADITGLLQRIEERADQTTHLPDANGGSLGYVRLHRDVLQLDSPTWFRRRLVTGGV